MNVTELVEAMHDTHAVHGPDLTRIHREGRRIGVRRRATVAAAAAVAFGLVAAPWVVLAGGSDHEGKVSSSRSVARDRLDDSRERAFEATAPLGAPVGDVADVDTKFYLGPDHVRSVGAMALWSETGSGDTLAYGARLIDLDGTLRRAGYLEVPTLFRAPSKLARVPGQDGAEPTFVGLVPVPRGGTAGDYRLRVGSSDTLVVTGKSTAVVPGQLLIWVTAMDGHEPGIALSGLTVRDAHGHVVARGTFPG